MMRLCLLRKGRKIHCLSSIHEGTKLLTDGVGKEQMFAT